MFGKEMFLCFGSPGCCCYLFAMPLDLWGHWQMIDVFRAGSDFQHKAEIGKTHLVLLECETKQSTTDDVEFLGRTHNNKRCIVKGSECTARMQGSLYRCTPDTYQCMLLHTVMVLRRNMHAWWTLAATL
jgi:hypothetical protein